MPGTFQAVNHAEHLPYGAHTIAAAIAPRALVLDEGTGDQFTNSKATVAPRHRRHRLPGGQGKAVYDWLGVSDKIAMSVCSRGHCESVTRVVRK